ncbi:SDR family oxidoreductase [Enterococcus sp. BWB1-3]|uniref:SDR family oxidoreductase n=1 Tax=unclassified Enterococcus TaxID=2608891 RepID=UPI001921D7AE|nr:MULTISPECIES: SDR family oxidoreductase [unclassified Enterococcus]MBL1230494.1 SDR family oxidoreductase [Enterococcus sp. BWB1-3]MCB5950874.1 SDR family oxidoreductase [Enterococcus sp. BWT-B8]
MNWLNIEKRVVIVTGASSGIGAAIAEELCELGAFVINGDINEGDYYHENLHFVRTDVTSRESVKQLVDFTISMYGRIDALVNNAGVNVPALLADKKEHSEYELTDELFEKMTSINQKGVYLVSQLTGRVMVKQKKGVIINMSSEAGLEGSEGQSCYAATKAAVNSFTRSWAKELGKEGIRVVGIAPGIMEETGLRTLNYETALAYTRGKTVEDIRKGYSQTSTIPLGRSGKLSEIADTVAYLISDKASYISGVTINVAGGKTRG